MISSRTSVRFALLLALGACGGGDRWGAPDGATGDIPRGGWDGNSGNWVGNLGIWGTFAGIGGAPPWGNPGVGTLHNAAIFGLQYAATTSQPACAATTADVTTVRFLSSTYAAGAATGPDVEVERTGGGRTRLAMGEEITFSALAFDGYLHSIETTVRVRRVDTLTRQDTPWYAWPVFSLELCENARPYRGFTSLGYVSWAPFMRLPETTSEPFEFRGDIVQPVTTAPRPEYAGNPDVPAVAQHQTGGLWFKFAFFASLPVGLANEPALALTGSNGGSHANNEVLLRGALALGNASWTTLPSDPAHHLFLTFFTKDGTEVAMFSLTKGNGASPGELRYPTAWGGATVDALRLTAAELDPSSWRLIDSIHARVGALGGGDVWAAELTLFDCGRSTYRVGRYMSDSVNPNKLVYYEQRAAGIAQARWGGMIVGKVQSQLQLKSYMTPAAAAPDVLTAAESPVPNGKNAFERFVVLAPPADAPWNTNPMVDAAVTDAPTDAATTDAADAAMTDAPTDAATTDATDAAMTDAATDAQTPDAQTPDAPPMTDGPTDADATDADADADDAPSEGPMDAASEGCAVNCDGAPAA